MEVNLHIFAVKWSTIYSAGHSRKNPWVISTTNHFNITILVKLLLKFYTWLILVFRLTRLSNIVNKLFNKLLVYQQEQTWNEEVVVVVDLDLLCKVEVKHVRIFTVLGLQY